MALVEGTKFNEMSLQLHDRYTIAFNDCKKTQMNNCFNEKTNF